MQVETVMGVKPGEANQVNPYYFHLSLLLPQVALLRQTSAQLTKVTGYTQVLSVAESLLLHPKHKIWKATDC